MIEGFADGVMIARGTRGNPWIFSQVQTLRSKKPLKNPTYHEVFSVMLEHARCVEQEFGHRALTRMRKHATWYCAGLPGASHFRQRIHRISTMQDLENLIEEYGDYLQGSTL
jgi:tRNA-dihydrouridine synthase